MLINSVGVPPLMQQLLCNAHWSPSLVICCGMCSPFELLSARDGSGGGTAFQYRVLCHAKEIDKLVFNLDGHLVTPLVGACAL